MTMGDDREAMETFLASVERRAFVMARLATCDADASLDIVQDAMLALVKHYRRKPAHLWKPLFYRILHNHIRDWFRRRRVRSRWRRWLGAPAAEMEGPEGDPLESIADPNGDDPGRKAEQDQAARALNAAIANLPLRQQQAFMLRAWEGLTVAEAAHAMGCSQGSVKTHYARAVASLRERLEEHRP